MAKHSLGRDDARPSDTQESPRSAHHVLDFPSKAVRVYAIASEATEFDVRMLLEARLAQLEALLMMPTCDGLDAFQDMTDDKQGNYLWACSYLATEARELYDAVSRMRMEGGAK